MSKLQRHGHLTGRSFAATPCPQEDEMYQVAYTIEVPRLCRICKHDRGQHSRVPLRRKTTRGRSSNLWWCRASMCISSLWIPWG